MINVIQDGIQLEITPVKLPIPLLINMQKKGEIDSFCYYDGNKYIHSGNDIRMYKGDDRLSAYPVKYMPISNSATDVDLVDEFKCLAKFHIDVIEDYAHMEQPNGDSMISYGKDVNGNNIISAPKTLY